MSLTSAVGGGTPRELAGSLTLQPPQPTTTTREMAEVSECGGNVQLMEARLCQITSSIRALVRSNKELELALITTGPDDPDFLQAIGENQIIIRRQGRVAAALVEEMQNQGCNIDLEDDIRLVVDGDQALANHNGTIAAVIIGGVSNNSNNEASSQQQPTGLNSTNGSLGRENGSEPVVDADGGMFL